MGPGLVVAAVALAVPVWLVVEEVLTRRKPADEPGVKAADARTPARVADVGAGARLHRHAA